MGLVQELDALDSPVPYHHAFECSKAVEQHEGQLISKYCKSRWCIVCNRIRTAQRIDKYGPIFREWHRNGGVHFVTLTVPNVKAERLADTVDEMVHQLKLCRRSIRRTHHIDYRAVRATEITYNEDRDDYHPHFHIAVRGRYAALALRDEWLKRWDEASPQAQNIRLWDGSKGALKELTKYCTKMIAPQKGERPPAEALDTIFRVLHGRHIFRPVGFELSDYDEAMVDWEEIEDMEELESTLAAFSEPHMSRMWWWDHDLGDWVDPDTGECLTGWEPSDEDRALFDD